jgi:hypothetical protein
VTSHFLFLFQAAILLGMENEDIKLNVEDTEFDCLTRDICIKVLQRKNSTSYRLSESVYVALRLSGKSQIIDSIN